MDGEIRQDLSKINIIIIPKVLDDADLDVFEFRVLCNLMRRSGDKGAWPSAANIARVCRMNEDTVWRAIKGLKERGFIRVIKRPGKSTLYLVTAQTEWLPRQEKPASLQPADQYSTIPDTHRKSGDTGNQGTPEIRGHHPPEIRGHHPPEIRGYEGITKKVNQEGIADGADAPPAPTKPRRSTKPVVAGEQKKPMRRNVAFDALAEIDGAALGSMTKVEGARIGKCLGEIRAAWPVKLPENPTPEQRAAYEEDLAAEIRRRAHRYRMEVMPHAQLTATALVSHWSKCAAPRATGIGQPLPSQGGRYALPDGCDWRAIAKTLGLRIAFDTPWHEVSHAFRAQILETHASAGLIS